MDRFFRYNNGYIENIGEAIKQKLDVNLDPNPNNKPTQLCRKNDTTRRLAHAYVHYVDVDSKTDDYFIFYIF